MWGKVGGWKGQGMSKAVKEVLVKSVVQVVPSYFVGCFELLEKLCHNLTSMSSSFWWGVVDGKKKVHSISWEWMRVSKKSGGNGTYGQLRFQTKPFQIEEHKFGYFFFEKKSVALATADIWFFDR